MHTSKARTLLKATLQTDVHFLESMRVYCQKTQCAVPCYENRLHFDSDEAMWNLVDQMQQCQSCGQILVSTNRDVCTVTNYCNKQCQRRVWKSRHKLTPIVKNLAASDLCVRILSIMSACSTSEGISLMEKPCPQGAPPSGSPPTRVPGGVVGGRGDIMHSLFSFEKKDALSLGNDSFAEYMCIDDDNNPVCNHFRQKQESNHILFPIWDTCTDNLAFVPVSFDFMIASPIPLVGIDESIRKNSQIYSVGVKCVDDGKPPQEGLKGGMVLPVATFVQVWQ